jgi:hypothetical protein
VSNVNAWLIVGLLAVIILLSPFLNWLFTTQLNVDAIISRVATVTTQVVAVISSIIVFMRKGLTVVKDGLNKMEDAKQKVDRLLAEKRKIRPKMKSNYKGKSLNATQRNRK